MTDLLKSHEIARQLRKVKKEGDILLWSNHQGHIIKLPLKISDILPDEDTLTFKLYDEAQMILSDILENTSHLRFYLTQGSYFFQVRKKYLTESGVLGVHFPEALLFLDRRKNERLYPDQVIHLEIPRPSFISYKQCYDLSFDGFSVVYTKSEQSPFEENEKIEKIKIKIDKEVIETDVVVHQIIKIKPFHFENIPYGMKKVSFKFVGLSEKDKNLLGLIIKSQEA